MKMSRLLLLTAFLPALLWPSGGQPAEDLPICYWQLVDEDSYVYGRNYGYRYSILQLDWFEIRKRRVLYRTASEEPKLLELRFTSWRELFKETVAGEVGKSVVSSTEPGIILVRDPDGGLSRSSSLPGEAVKVSVPSDGLLNGRYLLGAHFNLGEFDTDGDGSTETVHAYPKHLVVHVKGEGRTGTNPDVLFGDGKEMPLEIAPAVSSAQSKHGGGTQTPHNLYEMLVLYGGRPLAGARVSVVVEDSGWQRVLEADHAGKIRIMPFDDRSGERDWQKYLFVSTHHDRAQRAFHVATLPIVVYRNRPEWRSQAAGFGFWTVVGGTGCAILIPGIVRHRRRRQRQALVRFEDYRVKGN